MPVCESSCRKWTKSFFFSGISAGDLGGIAMRPDFRSIFRRPEAVGKVGLEASKFTIHAPNELKVKEGLFVGRKIQIEKRAETVFACLRDTTFHGPDGIPEKKLAWTIAALREIKCTLRASADRAPADPRSRRAGHLARTKLPLQVLPLRCAEPCADEHLFPSHQGGRLH